METLFTCIDRYPVKSQWVSAQEALKMLNFGPVMTMWIFLINRSY